MLLYLATCCISVTTILYAIHYLIRGGRKGELIDRIPGPYAWPLFGNIMQVFMIPSDQIWDWIHKINKKYYPIHRIWGVDYPVVNIHHPDDVEAVLSSTNHIDKSSLYKFLHPWLGTGLLTSSAAKWHVRRRILTPAFHFNVLRQFVQIFMEQSEKLVQPLCPEGEEVVSDLVSLLHKYTVNSICETAMGSTSEIASERLDEYRTCVSKMGDIMLYRLFRPWVYVDWMFRFFKKFKEQVQVLEVLHGFSTSTSLINAEMILFHFAKIINCKENKEIQDTARDEVDAIFEGRDRSKLSMRDIQSLAYLERCIKESLRLFPSVPFIARQTFQDIQLKNYLVPAGTLLHMFILDLHRDPNFWPNPEVFDPDRFLPDQVQGRHPFAFVPFSAGPRNCIGQKFAMLEMKALIGTFLHNFYLEPIDLSSEVQLLPDLVIRPKNPIRIKLVRRSHDD